MHCDQLIRTFNGCNGYNSDVMGYGVTRKVRIQQKFVRFIPDCYGYVHV
jgi:hypothetical protein